jgi:hypothetical protein
MKTQPQVAPRPGIFFLELPSLPEYKPIGGGGDAVMERNVDTWWSPLLAHLCEEDQQLVAGQRKTAGGLGLEENFNVMGMMSKHKSLIKKYSTLKRQFKVGRHQVRGETGAAADGQPATALAAINAESFCLCFLLSIPRVALSSS